jgi:type I restriction enzyme S subunit
VAVMAGKYQAYPEYKDSGVEWFCKIPEHWLSTRLKFESTVNMGQSPNSEDCNQDGYGLPFLQGNAEFGFRSPLPKQYCDIPRKVANMGDMLFSVRAPVGALNIADQKYGIGRGLCAITSNGMLNSDFLWWLIPVIKSELNAVSTGSTFEAVSAEQVENVVFFRPLLVEQQQIANFLDHETAKIDTLIEKQQQLIQLLKEKRQAVISSSFH